MTFLLQKCSKVALGFSRNFCCGRRTALVLLADGVEELEVVSIVDILRRAEIKVSLAAVSGQCPKPVLTANRMKILPDAMLHEVVCGVHLFDALILPGGYDAANTYVKSEAVGKLLQDYEKKCRYVGAICAAPLALKAHGVFCGKTLTAYPAVASELTGIYSYCSRNVVIDEYLITSRGPGTAVLFGLALVEHLLCKEVSESICKDLLLDELP